MTAFIPELSPNDALAQQRRLIHEHYGMVVIAGMVLEKTLWILLMTTENGPLLMKSRIDKEVQAMLNKHRSWTFGQLLAELKKKVDFPDELEAALGKAVKDRNYLVHHFILEKSELLKSIEGLSSIDVDLKKYYDVFVELNGLCDKMTEMILKGALRDQKTDDGG